VRNLEYSNINTNTNILNRDLDHSVYLLWLRYPSSS